MEESNNQAGIDADENMPFPAPTRRAMAILRRQRSLKRNAASQISGAIPFAGNEENMENNLRRTIAALERAGASWVVVGAEALNIYVRPRATEDVDIVVAGGRFAYVLEEMRKEFENPQEVDISAAVRFPGIGIDLVRSTTHALFRIALERAVTKGPLRVPPPEVLLALKFLSCISPWRADVDRKQDALDLIRLYQTVAPHLDRAEATRLAGLAYPGAEREFTALLEKIDRGEEVKI